ncbi:cytochrome p450 [Colletotrichum karsti]|uniref:Cytochrome p450 n=1 Tax=Colletotrichum karsti TaxID=1095194 RepID=A0A9P6IAY4_9PEZI|nr:cytochrome p450 [Colletotrichum karsti]KAF9880077.1 cytochrome p450 [Colletotrichum karsti]
MEATTRQGLLRPVLEHPKISLFLITILVLAIYAQKRKNKAPGRRVPAQPPATPILGHLPELIRENRARRWHLKLCEWAREYGPLFGVRTGFVVDYYVNSDVLVKEIFDKRSAQTADRPTWIMSSGILNNDFNVLFLDASHPRWKNQRKVIQQLVTNVQQADKIVPLLEYETLKFLRENVLDESGGLAGSKLYQAIGRYTYSAFATAFMGMEIPDTDDPVIPFIMEAEIQIINTFPGSNIIDLIPSLGKLPMFLKPWERRGRARYQRDLAWAMKRVEAIEERLAKGDTLVENTFLGQVLRHEEMRGMSCKEEVAILGLSFIVGAADTSRMTTWAFLEAMMMFPEVQAKAQREIGKFSQPLVGDRVPTYADFHRIPYVRMMMKEVWRWRPPVALGHPHITARDMQVGEYFLPKGAISHDPARHEDPERFWPERFKDDETTTMESINSQDPTKRDHFAFGAGRRVCPGYHVAERSFVITMMRILWAFDIAPAPGTKTPLSFADYAGALPGNPAEDMPVKLRCRGEGRRGDVLKAFEEESVERPAMVPLNLGEKSIPTPDEYL